MSGKVWIMWSVYDGDITGVVASEEKALELIEADKLANPPHGDLVYRGPYTVQVGGRK